MAPPKKSNLKQGTLFSFFSKKPEKSSAPPSVASTSSSSPRSSPSAATPAASLNASRAANTAPTTTATATAEPSNKEPTEPTLAVGTRLEIYWPDDERWYAAVVQGQRRGQQTRVVYTADDTDEWIALRHERWREINNVATKKRRVVLEEESSSSSSEQEMEFDDKEESSDFDPGEQDEEDDDEGGEEDDWIVSDNEEDEEFLVESEDEEPALKKKQKKSAKSKASLVVRPHRTSTASPAVSRTSSVSSSLTTPLSQRQPSPPSYVTPPAHTFAGAPRTPTHVAATPLPYTEKALNPAGAHVHNHLNFVRHPRDAMGRPPTHPDYDPRTLRIVPTDWQRHHNGKPMTDAVQQWWELKAQYFDTVLLFKTGKFYEMFHMDADVGVQVCSKLDGVVCAYVVITFVYGWLDT